MAKGEIGRFNMSQAIQRSWSMDTSMDSENWSPGNPAWGQCAVTALTVQDFLGGEIVRLDLTSHSDSQIASGKTHYFNRIGDADLDISVSQFGDENRFNRFRRSQETSVRSRSCLLEDENTRLRYINLRLKVAKYLARNNPLFKDPIYRMCLVAALVSDCQKGKYGCAVQHEEAILEVTHNRILECNRDWTEPQCIRINIPARTESMIGCCGHAEEFAFVKVRDWKLNPAECNFYVAGFRSSGLVYIKPEKDFTCLRCATQLYMHKVGRIFVPVKDHWEPMTAEEAVQSAKKFATQEKKLDSCSGS